MIQNRFRIRTIIVSLVLGLLLAISLAEVSAETLKQAGAGEINGSMWCESAINHNASFDTADGDTGLSGLRIALYSDANCDSIADGDAMASMTAGEQGSYAFSGLMSACYVVQADQNALGNYRCHAGSTSPARGVQLSDEAPQAEASFQFEVAKALAVESIQTESQTGGLISPNLVGIMALGLAFMTLPLLMMRRWNQEWD